MHTILYHKLARVLKSMAFACLSVIFLFVLCISFMLECEIPLKHSVDCV